MCVLHNEAYPDLHSYRVLPSLHNSIQMTCYLSTMSFRFLELKAMFLVSLFPSSLSAPSNDI